MNQYIVYFDMDGVLAFFDKRWEEMYNESPAKTRKIKKFSPLWEGFVLSYQFETLDFFPGAQELYSFVKQTPQVIGTEILSSSGGELFYPQVKRQKHYWLRKSGFEFDAINIVPGRRFKKNYATSTSILIDDTPDVIESFNAAGGIGILHTDANETIETLRKIFQNG